MNTLNKNTITSESDFNAYIDLLGILISNTIAKKQITNAEKYLKYFFEVMIKTYQRKGYTNTQKNIDYGNLEITTQSKEVSKKIVQPFENRTIQNVYNPDDKFLDHIIVILSSRIKEREYNIFSFILSLYKDSIRELLSADQTAIFGYLLIRHFKFITNDILSVPHSKTNYQSSWFKDESYNWFTELYSNCVFRVDDIQVYEIELLFIIRYYIDDNQKELFSRFLNSLSRTNFNYDFFEDQIIRKFKSELDVPDFKFDRLLERAKTNSKRIKSISNFKKDLNNDLETIVTYIKEKNIDLEISEAFIIDLEKILISYFKEAYIKVILIKSIVYAFFKNKIQYFEIYHNYSNPPDADATWASQAYDLNNVTDLFDILNDRQGIITDDMFFYIDHHGFTIYLNTFLLYYLNIFNEEHLKLQISQITDYQYASNIHFSLEQVKLINKFSLIEEQLQCTKLECNSKLDILISLSFEKKEALDRITTIQSSVDQEIVDRFANTFLKSFLYNAPVRNILKYYNLIEYNLELEKEINGFGINQLIAKDFFIKEKQIYFHNFPETFADWLSLNESLNILFEIQKKCEKRIVLKQEFQNFLNDRKYDIIISNNSRYDLKSDFGDLEFKESWAIIPKLEIGDSFVGIVANHFKMFAINKLPFNGYIILNSHNLGTLRQLKPPQLDHAKELDIFNFSLIDLNLDEHISKKNEILDYGGVQAADLEKNLLLRVLEKFEFIFSSKFDGIYVEIDG